MADRKFIAPVFDFLAAVQFLTRIPLPNVPYQPDSLARSVKYFPLVGLLLGGGSVVLYFLLRPHIPAPLLGFLIVLYLVVITGCLHEDGLADAADGFGGGWDRDKILTIMHDSRIGSYGAAALVMSLLGRVLLTSWLPGTHGAAYLIATPVLSRWTALPLSFFLAPTGSDGQGARIARLTSSGSLALGSLFAFVIVFSFLRIRSLIPIAAAVLVTWLSGMYYQRRIGGVTGDCFGATSQLAELAVLLCGVWI